MAEPARLFFFRLNRQESVQTRLPTWRVLCGTTVAILTSLTSSQARKS